ncbi:piwi-like protein Ago3 [Caerostris extrusa]|uniref:Piwi-like protein Ago3 n=1 Tax=Caerostris extrusa TaxID=172846 RepID=A0AAV4T9V1_CAEEX|nr:piwi-like protein Ago3 [Caerostris extrusa]
MVQVGRNFFDPQGGIPVPQHSLEIWPGYVTAVQEYEGGVMLNCDASFRVLRNITAKHLIQNIMAGKGNVRDEVVKALVGCVVLTRYNNKTYTIDDIEWNLNPNSSFTTSSGLETTFFDYYKRSYDIVIKDLGQPLLINKPKKKRDSKGVMRDIAVHTRVHPESRQLALQKFITNVHNNPEAKSCFDSWNLELVSLPINLDGRSLEPEFLDFGGGTKVSAGPEADWGRQITHHNVLVPVHFVKWAVIFPKRDSGKIREFVKMLRNVCPKMGIDVKEPQYVEILNDRTETYCEAIKDMINPTHFKLL